MDCPQCSITMVMVPASFGKPDYPYCRGCKKELDEMMVNIKKSAAQESCKSYANPWDGPHTWHWVPTYRTPYINEVCDCGNSSYQFASAPILPNGVPASSVNCAACVSSTMGVCIGCLSKMHNRSAAKAMQVPAANNLGSSATTTNSTWILCSNSPCSQLGLVYCHHFTSTNPHPDDLCNCCGYKWKDFGPLVSGGTNTFKTNKGYGYSTP